MGERRLCTAEARSSNLLISIKEIKRKGSFLFLWNHPTIVQIKVQAQQGFKEEKLFDKSKQTLLKLVGCIAGKLKEPGYVPGFFVS